jgi:hypothetical protein
MAGAHRKVGRMPVYAGCGLEPILTRAQRRGSVSQDRFRASRLGVLLPFCLPAVEFNLLALFNVCCPKRELCLLLYRSV